MAFGRAALITVVALGLVGVGVVGGAGDVGTTDTVAGVAAQIPPATPYSPVQLLEPPVVKTRRAQVERSGGRYVIVLETRGAGSIRLATAGYSWAKARPRVTLPVRPKVVERLRRQGSLTVGGFAERSGTIRHRFMVELVAPKDTPTSTGQRNVEDVAQIPSCDANYTPCAQETTWDLDCPDIGFRVSVSGDDPHRLDPDGDGVGCELY